MPSERPSLSGAPARIAGRVFVVGFPRSGTTLLQTMLARHPRLHSFPETHFFLRAYPLRPWRRWLGSPAGRARACLPELARTLGLGALPDHLAKMRLSESNLHQPFVELLDATTLAAGCDVWIEKTPAHLHCMAQIAARVPGATFVHVVRDGLDAVASLYAVTRAYPAQWGKLSVTGWFRGYSLRYCVKRWNRDVQLSEQFAGDAHHHVVSYRHLARAPRRELEALCRFLGIDYDARMAQTGSDPAALLSPDEPWKSRNRGPVEPRIGTWSEVLSESQRRYVERRLRKTDLI